MPTIGSWLTLNSFSVKAASGAIYFLETQAAFINISSMCLKCQKLKTTVLNSRHDAVLSKRLVPFKKKTEML